MLIEVELLECELMCLCASVESKSSLDFISSLAGEVMVHIAPVSFFARMRVNTAGENISFSFVIIRHAGHVCEQVAPHTIRARMSSVVTVNFVVIILLASEVSPHVAPVSFFALTSVHTAGENINIS